MKVGTITFNGAHNNGALLQAYALQTFLEKNKFDVNVINYRLPEIAKSYRLIKHRKRRIYLYDRLLYAYKYFELNTKYRYKYKKREKCEHFINNELKVTKECKTLNDLRNAEFDFDALVCGSDQIWNYNITKGVKPAFFLDFGKKDALRVSYAASLGVETIPEEYKDVYERNLQNLDFISVREESAKKALSPLTSNDITVVLDPTLLLKQEDYEGICTKPKYNEKYIYYHQLIEDPEMVKLAKYVSKKLGLRIVTNLNEKKFDNELQRFPDIDPKEFLGMIQNAEFVITNSFHATVFSVLYEKHFFTVPHLKYPTRMVNLLTKVKHEHLLISKFDDSIDLDKVKYDYKLVNDILDKERKQSAKFLLDALHSKEKPKKPNYLQGGSKFTCYGCSACKNACPKNCIKMEEDSEGFEYPKIDKSKCIDCKICEKACIYKKESLFNDVEEQKAYAVMNRNPKVRQTSTSGGMFTSIAEHIINQGGSIVGVAMNEENVAVYKVAGAQEWEQFKGAKYVRAQLNDVFKEAKEILDSKIPLLFTGTPCVVAGFKSYLNKEYDNLYLVDILCHSNGSPKVLKAYFDKLEEYQGSKIKDVKFRDKTAGWRNSRVTIKFENNKTSTFSVYSNNYTANFLTGVISRPSCYSCEFSYQKRVGDITIGDYWAITKEILDDGKGTSLVLTNNKKGQKLFDELKDGFDYQETPREMALQKNHSAPIMIEPKRYNFFRDFENTEDTDQLLNDYNARKDKSTLYFGNAAPIFIKTKKHLIIYSTCVYKAKIDKFRIKKTYVKVRKDLFKPKFLLRKGFPIIKGYKVNLFYVKLPISKIVNYNIQNKIYLGYNLDKDTVVETGIGYDLFNLKKGHNRTASVYYDKKSDTSFYLRQSERNATYLTVREYHKTDKKIEQIKINFAKFLSLFVKKDIVLLFEKESRTYEESASVLFERLIDMGYKNVYYILSPEYKYLDEIKDKYKKYILKKGSIKHYLYFFVSNKFISTESLAHAIDLRIANKHAVNKIQAKNNKYVFLQHGVMYMISLSSELKVKAIDKDKFYKVVVSSEAEADHFVDLGGYNRKDLYVTGLAKFDRSVRHKNADKIVIMLTWRRWEYNDARVDFTNTKYYKFIERIINAIPADLRKKVVVIPHPLFLNLVKNTKTPLSKYLPEDNFRYDEILKDTSLLITDYSSISYDAFYRGSNVIFCFEERDECLVNYGPSSKLMLNDDNAFGDVCYDVTKIAPLVKKNYNSKQTKEHLEKYKKIVEFNDNKNTDRIIEQLKKDKMI